MTEIRFTWNENKNISNQRKHDGIAFEVAAQVFRDPLRLTRQDRIEGYEMRWQTIGSVLASRSCWWLIRSQKKTQTEH